LDVSFWQGGFGLDIKKHRIAFLATALCLVLFFCPQGAEAGILLKKGMENQQVRLLQADLARLGFFNTQPTGYFGDITEQSVKSFQKAYGLEVDGIAGTRTLSKISELLRGQLLLKGMECNEVAALQQGLKVLGFFNVEPTGYYGEITEKAVKEFQKSYGLLCDGIAGKQTLSLLNSLLTDEGIETAASRSTERSKDYLYHWDKISTIFTRGTTAVVLDIKTGLSFNVKRTYGDYHSDTEVLTKEDASIMKKIFGGEWSWEKRPVIVEVKGQKFAASMNGMPHAGVDSKPEGMPGGKPVSGRSGGYGTGYNYDSVKNNGMDGHFCIHFYGSKLHADGLSDYTHQEMVRQANEWARKNLTD
jgi:peptidoglycan hydrolase-like protein with peptidoglycan-binding domain